MSKIVLSKPNVEKNIIIYCYNYSSDLSEFFSKTTFKIEYPEPIESIPISVLVIPFVCNVLPIIWLTNSELVLDELDKDFLESIPLFKKGYIEMFPEAQLNGCITVNRIINNCYHKKEKSAMFYSGGLDSAQTLIKHLDEKPDLLSIWGSDISYNNIQGWKIVHSAIKEAADRFNLKEAVIKSTFREFDNELELSREFFDVLKDGWWHGIKHSLALLGHVAPYVYLHQISKMYIAASNCPKYGYRKCASNPQVDNNVRFCGCSVFHDGFELSRQDKIREIVNYSDVNDCFTLHVCWENQNGKNCCHCEKCYRTICELWAENANPERFGFEEMEHYINQSRSYIYSHISSSESIQKYFPEIKERAINNKKLLKHSPYYKHLKWIIKTDFSNPKCVREPYIIRLRSKLYNYSIYHFLSRLKHKYL